MVDNYGHLEGGVTRVSVQGCCCSAVLHDSLAQHPGLRHTIRIVARCSQVVGLPACVEPPPPPPNLQVVHEVLGANQCTPAEGHRRLVLDVGANFGYFALYAASMGCR